MGALSSRQGRDFQTIARAMEKLGYHFGPMVINASLFLPQSRPRLFVVAVHADVALPSKLVGDGPDALWHPKSITTAFDGLSSSLRDAWLWWHLPHPSRATHDLMSIVNPGDNYTPWHTTKETAKLLAMMSPANKAKLDKAKAMGRPVVGTVYRRTRRDERQRRVQRAEVRFDQISGCLRTPAGGSSRQIIMLVEGERVRSRLLSAREAAKAYGPARQLPSPSPLQRRLSLGGRWFSHSCGGVA